jgi:hypothetical protein
MFNWFKKKLEQFKTIPEVSKASVLPLRNEYPRSNYSAHWEIIPLGKTTIVRIYSNTGKLLTYSTFEDNQKEPMLTRISVWLKIKMESYKV